MSHPTLDAEQLVRRFRRRGWQRSLLDGTVAGLAAGAVAAFGGSQPPIPAVAAAIVALCTVLLRAGNSRAIRADRERVAEHLDRRFPALEESSRLLMLEPATLGPVQRLQLARIETAAESVRAHPERWLPRRRLLSGVLLAALCAVAWWWGPTLRETLQPDTLRPGEAPQGSAAATTVLPVLRDVHIEPPAYTSLPPTRETVLDLTVPEGATVTWRFDDPAEAPLRLVVSDGNGADDTLLLGRDNDGNRQGSFVVRRSALYRLERLEGAGNDESQPLPGIHTLTVTLDSPPRLRVREPLESALDIPPDGPLTIDYRVDVQDDHGVDAVEIRASVAKGSGEGVKFRDAVFDFDTEAPLEEGKSLQRKWNLAELGMEPGDEVYFFTVARDNRPDTPNEGRSDTVVVRWLDEAPEPVLTEGLAIDVLPDYFKSQRQIIVETEQLIADRDSLATAEFDDQSRALGQAQSDLKGRYGQYLGDEFEEGGSPFAAGETGGDDAEGAQEADDEHDHGAEDHDSHDHGPDTSGDAADLVERFMHDHGAADIGPITRRNPVGLMKRSISNMWQAELHLRLSDPETALPFEYEALKYLNLARQADRIYTRRLGFEPPPVSEERRLTGELEDISSRTLRETAAPDSDREALARELQGWLGTQGPGAALDDTGRDLLRRAAGEFLWLSNQRPALIQQAATLEKMLLAGSLDVPDCSDCLERLQRAAWTLLPPAMPAPGAGRRPPLDPLGRAYLEAREALEVPVESPAETAGETGDSP